jgi:cellobiose phosphorylase
VKRGLDVYECRHGAGYTTISSELHGIAAELRYFVPEPWPCELWVLRVRNVSARRRSIRTFSYVELGFPESVTDQQNLDWAQHIVRSRCEDGVVLVGTGFRPDTIFCSSSRRTVGFDGDRESFVGPYRNLANPIVVERGAPTDEGSPRGNSIASLCHELDLEPGEQQEIVFVLGIAGDRDEADRVVAAFRDPAAAERAFAALREDWDAYLSHLVVATPDPQLDAMVNFWNPVQCRATLAWSRFASGYETGLGRGMGTRDSAQDTLGTMAALPDRARATLTRLWALQFRDGHAWHQFFPLTGEGSVGHAAEIPEWPQWFCDDHLWLVIATCAYLRENGDLAYLEQPVGYADAGGESVWGHMLRAVRFTLEHRGPHGLPRPGFADWDDTLNVDHGSGRAESVWCGMQFCRAALDLAEVASEAGRPRDAEMLLARAREMKKAINEHAWDGEWYGRAFDDEGAPIGVSGEAVHWINMNPQTWSVIGEVAPSHRATLALAAMDAELGTPHGIALLASPYEGDDPRVRGPSTYPPGAKENGGIFCHANAWAVVAAAMLGWNDQAYAWYRSVLPLRRSDADRYLAEPYVYCQNICGPAHPQFGMARNTWLTGTAAWMYVAATQWILGIRPTFRGLRVAPAMPSSWSGFTVRRMFRGASYEIVVERAGPGNSVALVVDGKPIEGDVVPLAVAGDVVPVRATVT